jgi:AcrR family transcriptional regulator
MGKPASDKPALLRLMATHVLEHGLNTASLRPLAKAANTSDRMLIYHFGTKDGLINALLQVVAADLAEKLEGALPNQMAPSVHDCALQIIVMDAVNQSAIADVALAKLFDH